MRGLWVVVVGLWCVTGFLVRCTIALLCRRGRRIPTIAGVCLASSAERLGGAFLKAGQILSTRVDLLPPDTISALSRLRDNVRPFQFREVEALLQQLTSSNGDVKIVSINPAPLASASIAQVHVGTEQSTGQEVAIKVRRPGIGRLLRTDVAYIRFFARALVRLPWFRRFPIPEATDEVCSALLRQADFKKEARMLRRFRTLFADNPRVHIPATVDSKCTDDLIVMENLADYRPIQSFRSNDDVAKTAVQIGLRALYRMIFEAGLIHCDLHASNILCKDDGTVALLDFGFVGEMTPEAKQSFAEFFLSIAFRDGKTAARIVRETALRVGKNLDPLAFERDMQAFVERTAGRKAADFQVAGFVFELFQIQRRHRIYGSPHFTLPILSLLTYEGMIKDIYPEIDFLQEAVPFVMASLAAAQ